jgi:hypothetical protein
VTPDPFSRLIDLKLARSSNLFATRYFYFVERDREDLTGTETARLTIECPWRLSRDGVIIVGSEDYGLPASTNHNEEWDRTVDQWGHLQNELLESNFGHTLKSEILFSKQALLVEQATMLDCGGFQINFTDRHELSGFPTSAHDMEWVLSFENDVYGLMNGKISAQRKVPNRRTR